MSTRKKPKQTKAVAEKPGKPNGQIRSPSIHLIRIPDREARKLAFQTLLALEEMSVRLPGYVMGVSTRQVKALEKQEILFEWVSKTSSNAQAVQS